MKFLKMFMNKNELKHILLRTLCVLGEGKVN